ncbi:hypothetical protein H2200_011648 [Cladophialophora chaetospira]|uniref:Uncharacterized protein n=1 Tax=Cladophialophora chaetospira TaxID=386627 RepID=A0AA38WZR3_9EURO|nr:hypothetical protein H2200_011648 [Cladophialophora chaetospira]
MAPTTTREAPTPIVLNDPDLIHVLGLDWTREQTHAYLDGIPKYYVDRLEEASIVPATNVLYAESTQVKQQWEKEWEGLAKADNRVKRGRDIQVLNRNVFRHVLRQGEDGLYFDRKTGRLVFAKLSSMVKDEHVLKAISDVCKYGARSKRGIRRDDGGQLTLGLWTGGPANAKKPTLSQTFRMKLTDDQKARIHLEESGVCTIVWEIVK